MHSGNWPLRCQRGCSKCRIHAACFHCKRAELHAATSTHGMQDPQNHLLRSHLHSHNHDLPCNCCKNSSSQFTHDSWQYSHAASSQCPQILIAAAWSSQKASLLLHIQLEHFMKVSSPHSPHSNWMQFGCAQNLRGEPHSAQMVGSGSVASSSSAKTPSCTF